MTRFIVTFIILLTLTSCYHVHEQKVTVPDPLIPKEEITQILTDIYLAEGTLAQQRLELKDKKVIDKFNTVYYKKIFNKYHINQRILKKNMDYYNTNPKIMEKIMEEVLARLSKLQSEVENIGPIVDSTRMPAVDSIVNTLSDSLVKTDSSVVQKNLPDSLPEAK